MGTYEINKISLSSFDDKRFVLNDDRFSQMITDKKRFKKSLIKRRNSHR